MTIRFPHPRTVLLAALVAAGSAPAGAGAAAPVADPCPLPVTSNHLVADATQPGVISLRFYDAEGARVVFWECTGGRSRRLGSRRVAPDPATNPATALNDAVTWACSPLRRRFAAIATLPDGTTALGTYTVRTVSCRNRLRLGAPRRVAPGTRLRIRVVDRWGIGAVRRRCASRRRADAAAAGRASARRLDRDPHGSASRGAALAPRGAPRRPPGPQHRGGRRGIACAAAPAPTVLATGDSTMQGIDSFLSDELAGRADVRSDVQPGQGISSRQPHYWTRHARSQTRRLRQRVTVISVGAATDGMPLATPDGTIAECCDAPWVAAYGRRVREMMRTFLQGGRARVFWLTPPLPRYPARRRITDGVNAAVVRAARGLDGVYVVRIDRFFSPNGYSDTLRYRGRDVRVRELDGIHLNVAGTSIAARLLAPAIRVALAQTAKR